MRGSHLVFIALGTVVGGIGCSSLPVCQKDLLIEKVSDYRLSSARVQLSQGAVKGEIEYLTYFLERGYGGRGFVPEADFQGMLRDLRKIDGPKASDELCREIDEVLYESIQDNHLKATFSAEPCYYKRARDLREGTVGPNLSRKREGIWHVEMRSLRHRKIALISLTGFPQEEDIAWDGFLDAVHATLHEAAGAIIDLRGNAGGADGMGTSLAALFYGTDRFPLPSGRSVYLQSPEALAMVHNYFRIVSWERGAVGKPVPGGFDLRMREYREKFQAALGGKLPVRETEEIKPPEHWKFDPSKGFDKPIYLLIDSRTESAAEMTVDAFESHPRAKRIGQNTPGTLQFGNAGLIVLPRSRIQVRIPTEFTEYRDGRLIERTGIAPDRHVPEGTDAFQVAWDMMGSVP